MGSLVISDTSPGSPHTVALSGTGQDVALSTNQPSATVKAGGTATFTLSIAPQGGFNQTVNLSCSLPAMLKFSTCAVTPASVTPSGTTASTATVTLTTTAPTLVAPRSEPYDSGRRGPLEVPPFGRMPWTDSRRPLLLWLVALLAAVAAASRHRRHSRGGGNQWVPAFAGTTGKRLAPASLARATAGTPPLRSRTQSFLPRRLRWALVGLALGCLLALSCGGAGVLATHTPGTPAGTYTITLTAASGNLSNSTTVNLTVSP